MGGLWCRLGVSCFLLALALASGYASAQTAVPAKFPEVAQRAAEAFTQNRLDDAAKLYREAVRLRPDWAEGWGYLAGSLYTTNRYADAAEAYRRTTILTPKNGPSWAYLGFCEYELRRYRQAFDHLVKSKQLGLADDPALLSKLHYELAVLWDTAGQFDMGTKELAYFPGVGNKSSPVVEATGLNVLRIPLFPYEIPAAKRALVMKAGEAGWNVNGHHVEERGSSTRSSLQSIPESPTCIMDTDSCWRRRTRKLRSANWRRNCRSVLLMYRRWSKRRSCALRCSS